MKRISNKTRYPAFNRFLEYLWNCSLPSKQKPTKKIPGQLLQHFKCSLQRKEQTEKIKQFETFGYLLQQTRNANIDVLTGIEKTRYGRGNPCGLPPNNRKVSSKPGIVRVSGRHWGLEQTRWTIDGRTMAFQRSIHVYTIGSYCIGIYSSYVLILTLYWQQRLASLVFIRNDTLWKGSSGFEVFSAIWSNEKRAIN